MGHRSPVDSGGARMPRRSVLFRVDAGPDIGLGHLQRCLSLASALRRFDARCIFLTNRVRAVQSRVRAFGFEADRLEGLESGGTENLKRTLEKAVRHQCDAMVVDSYHADADYLGLLRATGLFVVAVDDLARHPFPCQLVVNGGAHALHLPYRSSSGDTRFLLGPRYALLHPEFWDTPPRTVQQTSGNVLVTLGGADPHNLMPMLLSVLDDLPGEFTVTAIVGPFFKNRTEIQATANGCRRPVRLIRSPDSIRDLMLQADLAISAGGQTLYELAAAGTPTVAVQVADNQVASMRALVAEGVVYTGGCVGEARLRDRVREAVKMLLADKDTRARMIAAGQRLLDGQGARRIAEVMVSV